MGYCTTKCCSSAPRHDEEESSDALGQGTQGVTEAYQYNDQYIL